VVKTIGLMGGMSWESSIEYYRLINEDIRQRLGGMHSARSVMVSVDFAEIEAMQERGEWDSAAEIMIQAAQQIEAGGADFLVICTNTMHKLADQVIKAIQIPLLHIADATAQRIQARGFKTIGLLGTGFTMEEPFYKGRLVSRYGLQVLTPEGEDRQVVHRVIYDELVLGRIRPSSRLRYIEIMERLAKEGAEGIILGCTEIGLLIKQKDSPLPLFDTTLIHAEAAVAYALGEYEIG
jgi:aspartate racemase